MWLETWSSSGGFVWDSCKIGPGRSLEFPVDHGKVTHFRRCRFGLIFIFWWVGFCFFWPRGSEMMSVDSWLFIIRPLRLLTLSSLFSGNPMQKNKRSTAMNPSRHVCEITPWPIESILQTSRNLFCDKPFPPFDRYPYLDMVRGFYHCLQVEPGIITDLAGTPFPGFRGQGCAFSDISG